MTLWLPQSLLGQKSIPKHQKPDLTVRIGIIVEDDPLGTIAPETQGYFKSLKLQKMIDGRLVEVEPIAINAFIRSRIKIAGLSGTEVTSAVASLVKKDLQHIHGLVIPGDDFNFPPFRKNHDPIAELLAYNGKKESHSEKTIFNMTAKEFYQRFPKHLLNPYPDSLIYEGIAIKTLSGSSFPMLSSCHGTLMYGFLHGANFKAGIKGHISHNERKTQLLKGSKAFELLGPYDTITKHFHSIALLRAGFPSSLINSGWEEDLAEIIEDPQNPYYLGFQGHPELSPDHPALDFLIKRAVRQLDKQNA